MIILSQWLCPHRHCSIAVVWDDAVNTKEEMEEKGEGLYKSGQINRRCGLCCGDLSPEHRGSVFSTIEEAEPWLRLFERHMMAKRAMLLN